MSNLFIDFINKLKLNIHLINQIINNKYDKLNIRKIEFIFKN